MKVSLIDEYVCSNGVKIQSWESKMGYDIVVIQDGIVQSTIFIDNATQAEALFLSRAKEIEDNATLSNPFNKKIICTDCVTVEMKFDKQKYIIETYDRDHNVLSTAQLEDFKDALVYYREKVAKHNLNRLLHPVGVSKYRRKEVN